MEPSIESFARREDRETSDRRRTSPTPLPSRGRPCEAHSDRPHAARPDYRASAATAKHECQHADDGGHLSDPEKEGPLEQVDAYRVELADDVDAETRKFLREPSLESFGSKIQHQFLFVIEKVNEACRRLMAQAMRQG